MAAWQTLKGLLPRRPLLRLGLVALVALAGGYLLDLPLVIAPDMLPAQWSDFSFWGERIRLFRDTLGLTAASALPTPELVLAGRALGPVLSGLAALCAWLVGGIAWQSARRTA